MVGVSSATTSEPSSSSTSTKSSAQRHDDPGTATSYGYMTARTATSAASNSGSAATVPEIEQLQSVSQASSVVSSSNSSRRRKIVEPDAAGSPVAISSPTKRQMDSPPNWYPSVFSGANDQVADEKLSRSELCR